MEYLSNQLKENQVYPHYLQLTELRVSFELKFIKQIDAIIYTSLLKDHTEHENIFFTIIAQVIVIPKLVKCAGL